MDAMRKCMIWWKWRFRKLLLVGWVREHKIVGGGEEEGKRQVFFCICMLCFILNVALEEDFRLLKRHNKVT